MLLVVCIFSSICIRGTRAVFFFFQAEDGIRDLVRSRGLGDVYKRQRRNDARLEQRGGGNLLRDRYGFAWMRGIHMRKCLSLIHI